jgi:hypothetical protein
VSALTLYGRPRAGWFVTRASGVRIAARPPQPFDGLMFIDWRFAIFWSIVSPFSLRVRRCSARLAVASRNLEKTETRSRRVPRIVANETHPRRGGPPTDGSAVHGDVDESRAILRAKEGVMKARVIGVAFSLMLLAAAIAPVAGASARIRPG